MEERTMCAEEKEIEVEAQVPEAVRDRIGSIIDDWFDAMTGKDCADLILEELKKARLL